VPGTLRTEAHPRDLPLALLAAFACGVLLALQSRMNGRLAESAGAFPAAWVSFGSGLAVLTLLWLLPRYRSHLARVPAAVRAGRLRPWQLLGGVAGGLLVATQTYAVPRVGVAAFLVAVIGGQTVSALAVDRLGLGPGPARLLTPTRLLTAALAVVGVGVAVLSGPSHGGELLLVPALVAFVVGTAVSVQQATNGLVTVAAGDSWVTAWLNFATGGLTVLLVGLLPVLGAGWPTSWEVPQWAWWGGLCGVFFIALAAWAVQHSGVLLFGLVTITSQMLTALVLDLLNPATRDLLGVPMLAGVMLTVLAAYGAAVASGRARPVTRGVAGRAGPSA